MIYEQLYNTDRQLAMLLVHDLLSSSAYVPNSHPCPPVNSNLAIKNVLIGN